MNPRKQSIPLHSALCRACGAWGLVLESGAKRPWLYCAQCGRTTQAPDRENWRLGPPAEVESKPLEHAPKDQFAS